MADLTDIQAAQTVKLVGDDATGVEQTPVQSTTAGGLHTNLRTAGGVDILPAALHVTTGRLHTTEPELLFGFPFGTNLDSQFWTLANTGTGSGAMANSVLSLSTGTTANSTSKVIHKFVNILQSINENLCTIYASLSDTGVTNNQRSWGAFNTAEGVFWQLDGTVPSLVTRSAGVDTKITVFNGGAFVLNTEFHKYDIKYSQSTAYFYQDDILIHSLLNSTNLYNKPHFPLRFTNDNIAGGATNTTLSIRTAEVSRLANRDSQAHSTRLAANATTTLKNSPGVLRRVTIGVKGLTANTLTLYDNTAGSGTILAVIDTTAAVGTLTYDATFSIALTAVVATGTAADLVVGFE